MTAATEMPARGHYLADEVGRLAGVSGQTIGQWSKNRYIRASQRKAPYPKVYAYQDVAEAIVVHELLDAGAKLSIIRRTIDLTRAEYGDWPLSHATLAVGGGKTYDASDGLAELTGWAGAQPLGEEFVTYVGSVLRRGGWAVRNRPDIEHIEVTPDRLSGRPTIRGRRVPAEDVAITAATEGGMETLHDGYDLSLDEINDAVKWWGVVQTYAEAS